MAGPHTGVLSRCFAVWAAEGGLTCRGGRHNLPSLSPSLKEHPRRKMLHYIFSLLDAIKLWAKLGAVVQYSAEPTPALPPALPLPPENTSLAHLRGPRPLVSFLYPLRSFSDPLAH